MTILHRPFKGIIFYEIRPCGLYRTSFFICFVYDTDRTTDAGKAIFEKNVNLAGNSNVILKYIIKEVR